MIPFNFIYCRPKTLSEAHAAYIRLQAEGENPVYYAGGSEIITMSRAGSIRPGAVIDIKKITECNLLSKGNGSLDIGAACTLNQIKESRLYPLLTLVCGRISDHTNQCRITLGGNLCGNIIYRETSLPMLLSDATVTVLGNQGLRTVPFHSVFTGRMERGSDELIVQLHVPNWALQTTHYHVKRTANEKIDYPLISMAVMRQNNQLRLAFSGICSYPFRSFAMESVINDSSLSCDERTEKAVRLLPEPAYADRQGSGEYRMFVLTNMLQSLWEDLTDGLV